MNQINIYVELYCTAQTHYPDSAITITERAQAHHVSIILNGCKNMKKSHKVSQKQKKCHQKLDRFDALYLPLYLMKLHHTLIACREVIHFIQGYSKPNDISKFNQWSDGLVLLHSFFMVTTHTENKTTRKKMMLSRLGTILIAGFLQYFQPFQSLFQEALS